MLDSVMLHIHVSICTYSYQKSSPCGLSGGFPVQQGATGEVFHYFTVL
jgi:hypothetical protein